MKNLLPDFSKKLVSVSFIGSDASRAVNCPHWEMQGGRLFLVGTVPSGGSNYEWCEGVVAAVAWENVTDYIVFNSVNHYQQRLAIYEKHKGKTARKK
jgi:hypothetical protein